MMKTSAVILRVSDLAASTAFWSDQVGMEVVQQIGGFTFLAGDPVPIILSHLENVSYDESMTEVVLESDTVRETYAELAGRGVPFEVDLRTINVDGDRELIGAHFRDPDGHYASLTGWVPKPA